MKAIHIEGLAKAWIADTFTSVRGLEIFRESLAQRGHRAYSPYFIKKYILAHEKQAPFRYNQDKIDSADLVRDFKACVKELLAQEDLSSLMVQQEQPPTVQDMFLALHHGELGYSVLYFDRIKGTIDSALGVFTKPQGESNEDFLQRVKRLLLQENTEVDTVIVVSN